MGRFANLRRGQQLGTSLETCPCKSKGLISRERGMNVVDFMAEAFCLKIRECMTSQQFFQIFLSLLTSRDIFFKILPIGTYFG